VHEHLDHVARLPGLPPPLTSGAHFDSLKAYVAAHGQPFPVLIDREGTVWSGHTVARVCCELAIAPATQVVDDGPAAALQELATRDLTVLETADLVRAVYDGRSTKFVLASGMKRSHAVSAWFRDTLGKERGFSPSQIEQYLRVARSSPDTRAVLAQAETLGQAMVVLRSLEAKPLQDVPKSMPAAEPSAAESQALEHAAHLMAAWGNVTSWTAEGIEILVGIRDSLGHLVNMYGHGRR
jgi:hypothetical protein